MCRKILLLFWVVLFLSRVAQAQEVSPPAIDTAVSVVVEERDSAAFTTLKPQENAVMRTVPTKQIDSLKAEEDYWYANTAPPKKQPPAIEKEVKGKSLFQQQWVRQLLWMIVLCSFIAVVLWYLAASNILIFRKSAQKINSDDGSDISTDDIFALDYKAEIAKAEKAKNYRLAVRLWYLQTLKDLAEAGLIDYQHGWTNSDYVTQLDGTSAYRDFFRLTRNFEYTWYGQFTLSPEAYGMMQADFLNFKQGQRR